jgi:hypothetical protein
MPLAETGQLQEAATNQWRKCQPEYQIENNTTNKIVQVPDILHGKSVDVFEEFVSEEVINLIMGQSILYANQKNYTDFSLNKEELRVFLAMQLLSGYHRLPQEDMYWEQSEDVGVPLVYKSLSKTCFSKIKRFLHLNDNSKTDKADKVYKVRPFSQHWENNFLNFSLATFFG